VEDRRAREVRAKEFTEQGWKKGGHYDESEPSHQQGGGDSKRGLEKRRRSVGGQKKTCLVEIFRHRKKYLRKKERSRALGGDPNGGRELSRHQKKPHQMCFMKGNFC